MDPVVLRVRNHEGVTFAIHEGERERVSVTWKAPFCQRIDAVQAAGVSRRGVDRASCKANGQGSNSEERGPEGHGG